MKGSTSGMKVSGRRVDGNDCKKWRYRIHNETCDIVHKNILGDIVFNRPDPDRSITGNSFKLLNEALVIGSGEKSLNFNNRLFLSKPPIAYQNEDLSLGVSLGCALSNIPIPLGPALGSSNERDLIKSYDPSIVFQLSPYRDDLDIDLMRGSNCIDLKISDNPMSIEPLYFADKKGRYHRSPRILPEIRKKRSLDKFIEMIREMIDVPVIVTISANDISTGIDQVLVADPDAIRIVTDSYSPLDLTDNGDSFKRDPVSSLSALNEHLDTFKSRKRGLKVIVDARIENTSDVVKLLCLGADGICIDHLVKKIILDQISAHDDKDRYIEFAKVYEGSYDWASIGEAISNRILAIQKDLRSQIHSLGIDDVDELNSELLRAATYDSAALSGLKMAGREMPLAMWRH